MCLPWLCDVRCLGSTSWFWNSAVRTRNPNSELPKEGNMPCSQGSPIEVSPRGVPSDPNREAKGSVCSCTIHPTALVVKFGFAISKGTRVWDRLFPIRARLKTDCVGKNTLFVQMGSPLISNVSQTSGANEALGLPHRCLFPVGLCNWRCSINWLIVQFPDFTESCHFQTGQVVYRISMDIPFSANAKWYSLILPHTQGDSRDAEEIQLRREPGSQTHPTNFSLRKYAIGPIGHRS